MNPFIIETQRLLKTHGSTISYIVVTEGTYNVETGSITNTESTLAITAYPKQVKVNQYNYPNLIGKVVTEFLCLASDFVTTPNPRDKIVHDGSTYSVEQVGTHQANGEKVLYKIIACKG